MLDFKSIEAEWFRRWEELKLHDAPTEPRKKYFVLEMFAYPSGDIHMGHFRNYTIGDIAARYRKMRGWDVLHPFGWDAFGQPAEGAAIKRGNIHPREWTINNIETGKKTLQRMALTYDWSREIRTCEPDYYKWTQWIFLQLHKADLAYLSSSWVNWCPKDEWALTNEQAEGGVCWRCKNPVVKKRLDRCWFFRTTAHAERLLKDIDRLTEWPESVRTIQRNWIGRSEGAEIDFEIEGGGKVRVFTTRPDTIYGVTFMAVSPESPLAETLPTDDRRAAVAEYVRKALVRDEAQREKEKDGVFTGRHAINPFNGDKVQLWVADYVLGGYGTGVVMGVPAHDQRDFEFARKYALPVKIVIDPTSTASVRTDRAIVSMGFGQGLKSETLAEAYEGSGRMVNSGPFDGTPNEEGIRKVTEYAASKGFGAGTVNYKLRDWLISRQRYWGCPIPIIHCPQCGPVPVPEKDLPVILPTTITSFVPKGRSPLADSPEFMKTACPTCGGAAERDPDTMDTFIDSSWYQFRYVDPKNDREIWSREEIRKWAPVDLYIGGVEHARGHCLYFRFITKVLFDLGLCPVDEPAVRLFNHGMVCDEKGDIMSKSKGNAVSPAEILDRWGVDVCRIAMAFFAPSEDQIKWSENGLVGADRFVRRVYELAERVKGCPSGPVERDKLQAGTQAAWRKLHQVIRKAIHSYEQDLHFNTVLSHVMELLNLIGPEKGDMADEDRRAVRTIVFDIVKILAPMAPFLGEELHRRLGGDGSIFEAEFPTFDAEAAREDEVEIAVQINGKVRGKVVVPADASEDQVRAAALAEPSVAKSLDGKTPRKVVVVKGRLVNIVV